jgi:hypothetical protein
MTMRAIHQKQMPALRCFGRKHGRLHGQLEHWSTTKRNSTPHFTLCQIDGNRVHFSDFRLKFIRALLG